MTEEKKAAPDSRREKVRRAEVSGKHWGGYAWFMSLGTILPLVTFLLGYVAHVTLVGAPLARRVYRFGIWLATLGQEPPGKDKLEAREQAAAKKREAGKKSLLDRIRPYSPPRMLERRGKPVTMPARVVWFVLVGWWLGAIWAIMAWSLFLLPYPLTEAVARILGELPSVMTLALPSTAVRSSDAGDVASHPVATPSSPV